MNPAVTRGQMLTHSFTGARALDAPAFAAAQLVGAAVDWLICRAPILPRRRAADLG